MPKKAFRQQSFAPQRSVMKSSLASPSIAVSEVARFSAQAGEWWNPRGAFRALHEMGPLRLSYIKAVAGGTLRGLAVLDVGCGGGLMAEAMAREGARVTGLDASAEAIAVAKEHAAKGGLKIDYRQGSAEALAQTGATFDVITALEIVEHVADPESFMAALANMLRPGGKLIVSTVNRTKRSFLLAVVAAEYLLGWVPAGTHDWNRFVKPSEMVSLWKKVGIVATDCAGVVYKPFSGRFEVEKGHSGVNYFMVGEKGKK